MREVENGLSEKFSVGEKVFLDYARGTAGAQDRDGGGCGCQAGRTTDVAWFAMVLLLPWRRRRVARPKS